MSTEIRNAIAAANQKFLSAFSRGDAAGLAATYTSNGQALPTNSDIIEGRTAISMLNRKKDVKTPSDANSGLQPASFDSAW